MESYVSTWAKTKDTLVIGLVSLTVLYYGSVLKDIGNRQIETNNVLAEMKKDLAILFTNRLNDSDDIKCLQQQLKEIEKDLYDAKIRLVRKLK
jgi:hypothetical protein